MKASARSETAELRRFAVGVDAHAVETHAERVFHAPPHGGQERVARAGQRCETLLKRWRRRRFAFTFALDVLRLQQLLFHLRRIARRLPLNHAPDGDGRRALVARRFAVRVRGILFFDDLARHRVGFLLVDVTRLADAEFRLHERPVVVRPGAAPASPLQHALYVLIAIRTLEL